MASRHHSLQLSEVADVMDLMMGMEEVERIRIKIDLEVVREGKARDLMITAKAVSNDPKDTEVRLLASVSVKCLDTNRKMFRDAVTAALYMLDGRIALNEFGDAGTKRA